MHMLHKYKDAREFWMILDEGSEISLALWADIARWKLMGVHFVICGDWAGQLLPMFDRWGDAAQKVDIQGSGFMHSLVNGLQLHLTTCRRSPDDLPHFELVNSLYDKAFFKPGQPVDNDAFKMELSTTLQELSVRFPMPPDALPDKVFCMSHAMRIDVNTVLNEALQQAQPKKLWMPWHGEDLPGFTLQPQSCWIWEGMEVIGCTRKSQKTVVNGYSYTVVAFDSSTVSLCLFPEYAAKKEEVADEAEDDASDGEDGEPPANPFVFSVLHCFFMTYFRLPFALPICYAQGKTFKDKKVLLMDTGSQHFTMRCLIVGISRVNNGSNLWIAPGGYGSHIREAAKAIYETRKRGDAPLPLDAQHLHRLRRQEEDDEADARFMEESDAE